MKRTPSWLWVGLVVAFSVLPGFGLKDPWPADEPRFVLIAQEMIHSGEWQILYRAGEPYSDKPPLFVWIESAILGVTGSIRVTHQLPGLLAGLLTLWLTWDLGCRLWNRRVGRWAALILATIVQFVLQARSGQIDAVLCAFTTLGLWGLFRATLLGPALAPGLAGFASMALGVVTKGVGFLPGLALGPWLVARRRGWRQAGASSTGFWVFGPLVFIAVLAAWLVPLVVRAALEQTPVMTHYINDLFFGQTVHRYARPGGHIKPPWYYLQVILWAWIPVSICLPWLIPAWKRRLQRRDARYLVLLGWIVLVILFFSATSGKRGLYLLPATPALALAVAPLAPGLIRLRGPRRMAFGLAILIGLVACAGGVAVALGASPEPRAEVLALPLGLLGLAMLGGSLWAGVRNGFPTLVVCLCAVWTFLGLLIYPVLDPARSGRALMSEVEERLQPGEEVAIVDWREQMILQAERPVVHFGYRTPPQEQARAAAAWAAEDPATNRVLIPQRFLEPCFATDPEPFLETFRRTWYLVSAAEVTDACRVASDASRYRYEGPAATSE